jgi:NAD(P)-dependent dehydrogenase (short-subunit alcohol dehydrogenase family)
MTPNADAPMRDKVCVVTGATSGIGLVTARVLAQQGATVGLVGRDPGRGAAAVEYLRQTAGKTSVHLFLADLSSQAAVHRLAEEIQAQYARLDVLVNNAGALFTRRQLSADGIEMTWALNHLAYMLLTQRLLDMLQASAPARIVNVASDAHRPGRIDFADLQGTQRYSGWRAYCQSKLANVMFTYTLAARLQGSQVTANVLHPGFVATRFAHNNRGVFAWLLRLAQVAALNPEQGAETMVYLATAPEVAEVSGHYFVKKRAVRSSEVSYDTVAAERLWRRSAEMLGLAREG